MVDGRPLDGGLFAEEWQTLEFACLPPPDHGLELWLDDQRLAPFLRPGDARWYWAWPVQQSLGQHELRLRLLVGGELMKERRYHIMVQPRKLERAEFQALLSDIEELGRLLCYRLAAAGKLGAGGQRAPSAPLERLLLLCGERLDELESAMRQLARRPPQQHRSERRPLRAAEIRDLSRLDPASLRDRPEHDPAGMFENRPVPSYDSPANRLLKRLLDELWREVQAGWRAVEEGRLSHLAPQLERATQRIAALRNLPMLADVPAARPGPAQSPQRWPNQPAYRRIARFWRDWQQQPALQVEHNIGTLPIQELPKLYEIWSALQFVVALLELPGAVVREQQLLSDSDTAGRYRLELRQDGPLLSLDLAAAHWQLFYQRDFKPTATGQFVSLDRHVRIPDLALEIQPEQGPLTLLLADAKYRLDAAGGVPAAALAEAYSYLAGIGPPGGPSAVAAVWLLYPGRGPAEHYASGVSSVPLLPGNSTGLAAALRRWVE